MSAAKRSALLRIARRQAQQSHESVRRFPAVVGAFRVPHRMIKTLKTLAVHAHHPPRVARSSPIMAFQKQAVPELTCLTGHVNKPGVYELRLGFPVMQNDRGSRQGASRNRKEIQSLHPRRIGLALCLPPSANRRHHGLRFHGRPSKSMLGSGSIVVMDEDTCMVEGLALRIIRFYAHESCGWCIHAARAPPGSDKILGTGRFRR